MIGLQRIEEYVRLRKRGFGLRRFSAKFNSLWMTHGTRTGRYQTRRIDHAPYRNADIATDQSIDRVKKSRMHFHEVDGPEIGDGRFSDARRHALLTILKTEATIDYRNIVLSGLWQQRYRSDSAGCFRREDKAHSRFHQSGRDQRFAETGNMRPEHTAHRGE